MRRIFVFIGKSSSGKDSLFKEILNFKDELKISPYVPYTTRPKRENEKNGIDYYFISDEEFLNLIQNGSMLESRSYNTQYGIWRYGTVKDKQFETDDNIIIVLTLEGYVSLISSQYIDKNSVVPIYIEVEDCKRLERAIAREKKQSHPRYDELCRRFLADSDDFSEEKIKEAGITLRFENNNFEECLKKIKEYILSFNK